MNWEPIRYKLVGFLGDGSEHDIPTIATDDQKEFTLVEALKQRKSLIDGGWLSNVQIRKIQEQQHADD